MIKLMKGRIKMDNLESLLLEISRGLVEDKEAVKVSVEGPNEEGIKTYHLEVSTQDKGRVIGKQGRVAKSIRTVMKAVAGKEHKKVDIEFVD
jgi:hypothetical protein